MLFFSYFLEFNFRILYIIISFIICVIISFWYFKSILLLETYPVIKGLFGKFIIIHITEIFDIIFLLVFSMSFFFCIPLFIYQIYCFFTSSWYFYQIQFAKNLLFFYYILIILIYSYYYYSILPNTLLFFTQWMFLQDTNYFLNMEITFHVFLYVNWVLTFRYNFIIFLLVIFLLCIHLILLYPILYFYMIIKLYRKQLLFLSITIIYIIIPPDVILQIILILFLIIIYEVGFFLICYKFINFNDNNYAYN
uniref:SecY n=1 Tax=Plocamium cartilagineum TaxID=31452 RepID=A0A0E3DAY2_PLOCA|nr:SecY [Plocamium cartilagineum]